MDDIDKEIERCATLEDDELWKGVAFISRQERALLTEFLIHVSEMDRRDVCVKYGFSSVFAYLTRGLGHSEFEAIMRIRAARAARNFPSIYRLLRTGEAHLTAVGMIAPFLTSENHRRLLSKIKGRRKQEIERLISQLRPAAPEPRDRVRALPCAILKMDGPADSAPPDVAGDLELSPGAPPTPQAARKVFTFAAGEEVHEWFLRARDLMRHKFPDGRMEDIIGEALRRLVEQGMPGLRKRRDEPRPSDPRARRIPLWVQDEVWRRDCGRCSYTGQTGIRCGETAWIEYDHVVPWAKGGRSDDPSNVRLLCRAHNKAEAERIFGVQRIIPRKASPRAGTTSF